MAEGGIDLTTVKNNIISINDEMKDFRKEIKKIGETQKGVEKLKEQFQETIDLMNESNDNVTSTLLSFTDVINTLNGTLQQQANIEQNINQQRIETRKEILQLTDRVETLAGAFNTAQSAQENFERAQQNMEAVVRSTTDGIQTQVDSLKTAMAQAVRTANSSDAAQMIESQRERRREFENLKKTYKELEKEEKKSNDGLSTRNKIMNKTINRITKDTENAKLPFFEGLSVYLEEGGTSAEYLAQFLTSTREELKVFGIEVASVRKFMYGFLPPGTFRLVNKFASTLNFVGGTLRSMKADAEESSNFITKTFLASTIDKKGIRRLMKKRQATEDNILKVKSDISTQTQIIEDPTATTAEVEDAKEAKEYLQSVLENQQNELDKIDKSIGKRGNIIARMLAPKAMFGKMNPLLQISNKMGDALDEIHADLAKQIEEAEGLELALAKGLKFFISATTFLFKVTMYLIVFALAFAVIKNFIQNNSDKFQNFFGQVLPYLTKWVTNAFNGVLTMVTGLMDIVSGIFSGDTDKIFEGIQTFLYGLGEFLINSAKVIIGGLGALLISSFVVIGQLLKEWWQETGTIEKISGISKTLITIAVLMGILSLLPIQLPLIVVAALSVVIFKAVGKIGGFFKDLFSFRASGGVVNTPMTIVGEKGPEILIGNQGSTVVSNTKSKEMLGRTVNNFNITINAKDSSKAEMRRMADEIGRMISSKINRSTSSSTFR